MVGFLRDSYTAVLYDGNQSLDSQFALLLTTMGMGAKSKLCDNHMYKELNGAFYEN